MARRNSSAGSPDEPRAGAIVERIDQIDEAWLRRVLSAAGLGGERIERVTRTSGDAFNSQTARLVVETSGPPTAFPDRLFVKLQGQGDGQLEVDFYRLAEELDAHPPFLVRVLGADYSAESGHSYCLLEDLSDTHTPPVRRKDVLSGRGVPHPEQLQQVLTALATLHAGWWNDDRIGSDDGLFSVRWWYRDRDHFLAHVERRAGEWAAFRRRWGESLPASTRDLYDHALGRLPELWPGLLAPRIEQRHHLTLTHGDCYLGQFLCPTPLGSGGGGARLVDFDSAGGNLAAFDLTFLMATFWTQAQRKEGRREERALASYHAALVEQGLEGFSLDDLVVDYRLMISLLVFDPIFDGVNGSPEAYWRPKLTCLTSAYEDLACADLA